MTESAPRPPQGAMLAVAALAATCFGMSLNANVLAALNPYLRIELGFDTDQLGALSGAAGLAGTAGALLLGPTVDRLGRRAPLLWGTTLFLVASCGYLVVESFAALLAVRLVTGFVAGIVLTAASSAVADLIPYERRGLAMGIVTGGILLAVPIGMPVAILLAEAGQWRGVFLLQIVASLVTLGALSCALPAGLGKGARKVSQLDVLRTPAVVPAILSIALYTGAFFATMQFLGTWLDETAILHKERQGWMWIVLGVVAALGGAALGGVSDKVGKRRFVLLSTVVVAVGLLLLARIDTLALLIVIGLPVGVVSASRSAALLALVTELVPADSRGTLMGVRTAAVNLGTGTFPWIAGVVYAGAGFEVFLHIAAFSMLAAYVLVRFGVPEPGRAS